ncbi:tight junction protein ZO-1 [Agrilus planipennis]|uniref:Tight junction protein ZO-1 n=1 Tax=Agrilus planipennis TaxID=224129 RepID=A0A1W4WEI6_AGRPL|nr:tight junction protein ZO-1 [Agrilus planipennis]
MNLKRKKVTTKSATKTHDNKRQRRRFRASFTPNNVLLSRERGWEYKQITITRVPGYGFGIAVSGGRDNPHFASGDPSIAVSDVLANGPAERLLHVNDRILSVNGISLQNVDYATAVQVLRDSGDTVVLVIKRRTVSHHHSHSLGSGPPLAALGINPLPPKITLTKNSKKEDFGIVLGCKLFVKEISSKAREQLLSTNQVLSEGDFITKINNTNCNDIMSLKEAKKIIDSSKEKLHLTVLRDFTGGGNQNISHQTQNSFSSVGAVNNFYKDDFLTSSQSYSNQNLYVQPPTRNPNLNNSNGGFEDKNDINTGPNSLPDDKNNLAPRGRLRQPLSEANMNQLNKNSLEGYGRSKGREEPPRPPPPRPEDYYSSRQLYDDDPIIQKNRQPVPDARYITFHKEGSVGIRLTGGNFVGIFVTAVQPGSPASLQGLQPGDKILKVNDMDMSGVTREEAVLFLLSLQDRIELIVQYCKEEYDSIVAQQKGDSFYIKTHFHYDSPAKGEMSFKSGDIFHVIDTLYNGVVGCWQVFRIGRNNQEVQKGIIPNKARAEELATAQFNATKKEMSANESRGSFFRRRRNSNRRSKSLGKEHWDDILFSDTVSKFPAYERVVLKHPGFTRPIILFGPVADVARDKLLKDFPDKFISPPFVIELDSSVEDAKSHKLSSNIIRLSAIREVISTGKHALLDITPNAVERLNYAQLYPVVVFFKAETKMVVKQMRQGLPKSAHKSSKKLLEQCQKLDKVWSHIFNATIILNDNTDTWYRKVREIIDKQQSGPVWMSESKLAVDMFSDIYFPIKSLTRPRKAQSLPRQTVPSYYRRPSRRTAHLSMYNTTQPRSLPRDLYDPYYFLPFHYASSECSICNCPIRYNNNNNTNQNGNIVHPEESLSDDFLFPMSSLRLSYASSPESDLEHSPGPPNSPGLCTSGNGNGGRLTKASSDPSVVMPDNSTTDILPPYQPTYDTRYGFSNKSQDQLSPNAGPNDSKYLGQPPNSQDIPGSLDTQNPYKQSGLYGCQDYSKIDYNSKGIADSRNEFLLKESIGDSGRPNNDFRNEFVKEYQKDPRNDYVKDLRGEQRNDLQNNQNRNDFNHNEPHKRQSSSLHGNFNHSKGHSVSDQSTRSPSGERMFSNVPDLPPRVDRAIKPVGLLTTSNKTPSGRSAHERLFGTKAPGQVDNSDQNPSSKGGSLERSVNSNSKSDSLSSYDSFKNSNVPNTRIIPNAHDDLKTTLSKIEQEPTMPSSPPKYGSRWDQNHHRHDRLGSKLDLKYSVGPNCSNNDLNIDASPRNSRELDKDPSPSNTLSPRSSTERDRHDMYRSPSKQPVPNKIYMETKTDYGKYSRNNNTSLPEYARSSHQDLSQSHLSVHQMPPHQHSPMKNNHFGHMNGFDNGPPISNTNGPPNAYKPIPPPKPKNYKPPYKNENLQPPLPYQHGKSHSNPVDQRQPMISPNHDYYYNMQPPGGMTNNWHTETAVRYNPPMHGPYDMAPPYEAHRHPSISYASRSEITPISQRENSSNNNNNNYSRNEIPQRDNNGCGRHELPPMLPRDGSYPPIDGNEGGGGGVLDPRMIDRPSIVDLQSSREQRGSAFELYRKPMHHNLR